MQIKKICSVKPNDPLDIPSFSKHKKSLFCGELYTAGSFSFFVCNYLSFEVYDLIIAKIYYKTADYYKCDINSKSAILPALSFYNATKRNKPDLEINDLIFCRIKKDGVLSCDEVNLGKVDGYLVETRHSKIKELFLTQARGFKQYKVRMYVGMNNRVVVNGDLRDVKEVVKLLSKI